MRLYHKYKGWRLSKKIPCDLKYHLEFNNINFAIKKKCYDVQISAMHNILLSDVTSAIHKVIIDAQLINLRRMIISKKNIVDIILTNCDILFMINHKEIDNIESFNKVLKSDIIDEYNSVTNYGAIYQTYES